MVSYFVSLDGPGLAMILLLSLRRVKSRQSSSTDDSSGNTSKKLFSYSVPTLELIILCLAVFVPLPLNPNERSVTSPRK